MEKNICPDCGGELEKGAIMDHTHGGVLVERYAKTEIPEENKIMFMAEGDFQDIRRVVTYRCIKCNRLFSYAQNAVISKSVWQTAKNNYLFAFIFAIVIFVIILVAAILTSK